MLRHCFWGSGASSGRSSSADSAAAAGGCGTGVGEVQHLRSDPCTKHKPINQPEAHRYVLYMMH